MPLLAWILVGRGIGPAPRNQLRIYTTHKRTVGGPVRRRDLIGPVYEVCELVLFKVVGLPQWTLPKRACMTYATACRTMETAQPEQSTP